MKWFKQFGVRDLLWLTLLCALLCGWFAQRARLIGALDDARQETKQAVIRAELAEFHVKHLLKLTDAMEKLGQESAAKRRDVGQGKLSHLRFD